MIVADFSRIFCDIERFVDDEVEVMSKYWMWVLYRKTDNWKEMRQFSEIYKKHIIKTYYDKHHLALSKSVKSELAKNRKALIIDCHSFSDTPFKRDLNQDKNRPDICIWTDPFHTSKKLLTLTKDFFANYKYSIEINNPYSWSLVPTEFYTKNKNVLSIMIELNRNLYLQPWTKQKSENYDSVKTMISSYLDFIKWSVI
jgi:N-formylglutamate amidohydrolase